jgi:hypothetical protein
MQNTHSARRYLSQTESRGRQQNLYSGNRLSRHKPLSCQQKSGMDFAITGW